MSYEKLRDICRLYVFQDTIFLPMSGGVIMKWTSILIIAFIFISCGENNNQLQRNLNLQDELTSKQKLKIEKIEHVIKEQMELTGIPSLEYAVFTSSRVLSSGQFPKSKNNIYDIASLTKIFTSTLILKLVEKKVINLDDSLSDLDPKLFSLPQHSEITLFHLLTHTSGFRSGLLPQEQLGGKNQVYKTISELKIKRNIGSFKYSDVNFVLLGLIIEKVTNRNLVDLLSKFVTTPLQLSETFYKPKNCSQCLRTASEQSKGTVHDPTARNMGGVAGSAGIFSTSRNLVLFFQEFLKRESRILSNESLSLMTTEQSMGRALGFDLNSTYSKYPKGDSFDPFSSFGHTGYTGTSIWIDPTRDVGVLFLSNAVAGENMRKSKKGFLELIYKVSTIIGDDIN